MGTPGASSVGDEEIIILLTVPGFSVGSILLSRGSTSMLQKIGHCLFNLSLENHEHSE